MPDDTARNVRACALTFEVDKITITRKGEVAIGLKYTRPEPGREHTIGDLVALQQAGTVKVTFEPCQQSLEFED